ncbi:MAG TPA: alpha/beta hydrolase [Terriglobales bacterium]|nr:alpha/beta hydrolase [Terriglobales bacterium]
MRTLRSLVVVAVVVAVAAISSAQLTPEERAAVLIAQGYDVIPNIIYGTANNYQLRLDVMRPHAAKAPTPVVMVIHGGGWVAGSKEDRVLEGLPYLQMGFAVVNVEYRLGPVSLAPAAVEDCLCALHWVAQNAAKYNFDVSKIVASGGSAGGHLALTTGMIPSSAGLDAQCASENNGWGTPDMKPLPKVAAIVNWFGITDVGDMLHGPDTRSYVISWFGSQPDRDEIARRVSPINYVRAGLPPIITIHGDHDPLVPYSQAVHLHQALDKAGVRNQLLTMPGAGHGGFTGEQMLKGYEAIKAFLLGAGIAPVK